MDNNQLPPGMFTPERPRNANGDSTIDQVRHAFPSPAALSRLKFLSRMLRAPRARRESRRDPRAPRPMIHSGTFRNRPSLPLTRHAHPEPQVASLSPFFDFASTLSPIAPSRALGGQGMGDAGSAHLTALAGARSPTPLCFNSPNAHKRYVRSRPILNLDRPPRARLRTSRTRGFHAHTISRPPASRAQRCACRQVRWRP